MTAIQSSPLDVLDYVLFWPPIFILLIRFLIKIPKYLTLAVTICFDLLMPKTYFMYHQL